MVLLTGLLVAATAATGAAASLPSSTLLAPGVPPEPSAAPSSPAPAAPAPARTAAAAVRLRLGSRGSLVRDLQRQLRRRGIGVAVDGVYGRQTRAAVRILQRRLRLRATGVADGLLLRRLGIRVRSIASGPAGTGTRSSTPATGARYLRAFPVQGTYSYFDDFGAPRAQGSHQGNDIMAARGTPVVAVADGVIDRLTRTETGLGGIWIWLRDRAGNTFYYAHLHTIAAGLDAGTTVAVGQVIGTVGNTGDARYGAPHLHFEIHPGGGGAINPYGELLAVDPARAAR